MTPRKERVSQLVDAAIRGMQPVAVQCTADEVISACLSLSRAGLRLAHQWGAPPERLRRAVDQLLLDCCDEKVH